jgi:regulator of sirC expression with transglutaminase-like and TPR domain
MANDYHARMPDLALFAHVVARPDAELDLAQAALLIAEPEYPGLDVAGYLDKLDGLADQARRVLPAPSLPGLARVLHGELGFHGNAADYYDPRNSYLNEVIDRRTGIPITLAVVLMEIARRLGVDAHGVSFPGHFLVGDDDDCLIDPFGGRTLDAAELRVLHGRATGSAIDPDPRLLVPATKRQILVRMLHNLRDIWTQRRDARRVEAIQRGLDALDQPPASRTVN